MLANNGNGLGENGIWFLALMMLFGGNWGNRGNCNGAPATQEFVQNGFNFNDLQDQNRDILQAISSGTAQAVKAANDAEYETIAVAKDAQFQLQMAINALQQIAMQNQANENDCCCKTLRAIDGVKYDNAQNTASINSNIAAMGQKIIDMFTGNRMADMQNQINMLQLQNAMAGVVRYPMASTYSSGNNPFCGQCCPGMC
jgi:hypothetical protein